jgi:hypothetical protein
VSGGGRSGDGNDAVGCRPERESSYVGALPFSAQSKEPDMSWIECGMKAAAYAAAPELEIFARCACEMVAA